MRATYLDLSQLQTKVKHSCVEHPIWGSRTMHVVAAAGCSSFPTEQLLPALLSHVDGYQLRDHGVLLLRVFGIIVDSISGLHGPKQTSFVDLDWDRVDTTILPPSVCSRRALWTLCFGWLQDRGVPKIKGTILGVPITRVIRFGGLYWGPPKIRGSLACSGMRGAKEDLV